MALVGLKEAVNECISVLKTNGHSVNVDLISDAIKGSKTPKYARFIRVKDQILKKEIQTILSSVNNNSANEQVRKLYLSNLKNSDTDKIQDPDCNETHDSDEGERQTKKARRTIDDSKRSDPGPSSGRYRKSRLRDETAETPSQREFKEETLPDYTLDAIGGADKAVQEIREHVIRPLKIPEIYKHLGIKPIKGILLHGSPGSGKSKLAMAAAGEAGVPFFKIAAPEIISGMSGESEASLRALFDSAKAVSPSLIFIDEIDAICPRRENSMRQMENRIVSQLNYCLDNLGDYPVIVLAATNRLDALDPMVRRGGRFEREIAMGIPDEKARGCILKIITNGIKMSDDVDFDHIAKITPGFVGADLEAVAKEAGLMCVNRIFGTVYMKDNPLQYSEEDLNLISVEHRDFVSAVQRVQPSAKREGFATTPDVTWDDVGGLSDQRTQLEEQICFPIKEFELHQRLGLKTPAGVLLCGPPGCGKTLLAKATAAESGANFISVKGPELLNKYVGESERAVRQVFERARASAPSVIFFDELDSLCCRRGSDGNSVSERVVNTLLTEMDGVQDRRNVYVIAATNRPELIDPAMLRPGRLEHLIHVPVPDRQKRVDILRRLGNRIPLSKDVDINKIAEQTERFSGADLAALLRQSVTLLLRDYRNRRKCADDESSLCVEWEHIQQALDIVKPSVSHEHEEYYKKVFKKIGKDSAQ